MIQVVLPLVFQIVGKSKALRVVVLNCFVFFKIHVCCIENWTLALVFTVL